MNQPHPQPQSEAGPPPPDRVLTPEELTLIVAQFGGGLQGEVKDLNLRVVEGSGLRGTSLNLDQQKVFSSLPKNVNGPTPLTAPQQIVGSGHSTIGPDEKIRVVSRIAAEPPQVIQQLLDNQKLILEKLDTIIAQTSPKIRGRPKKKSEESQKIVVN